jgi:hypothetical protein
MTQRTPAGASEAFHWARFMAVQERGDAEALATAGLVVLAELLGRAPDPSRPGARQRWFEDVEALCNLLSVLGLAGLLQAPSYEFQLKRHLPQALIEKALDFGGRNEYGWLGPDERYTLGCLVLFGGAVRELDPGELEWFLRHWKQGRFPGFPVLWNPAPFVAANDPLELLMCLPLPASLHALVPADVRDRASVYHLLNVLVSEPQAVHQCGISRRLALSVALFAAACIASRKAHPANMWMAHHLQVDAAARAQRVTEEAYAWLAEHLPRRAYAEQVERLLGRSKLQRYHRPGQNL